MSNPLLIIDTNYLCHRAFHALGDLRYGDVGIGAVYGVLRDIVGLQEMFKTNRCVFAFDAKPPLRRHKVLPAYKSSRRKRHEGESAEDKEARADFIEQVRLLRTDYLPAAGFNNVFHTPGFEADDIIARVAQGVRVPDEAVIVASDQDLWQCIRPHIWCWSPHNSRGMDQDRFLKEWGLLPRQWVKVKAIAGCSTDDIPGVPGVGEKTAAKWLRGELGAGTKKSEAIVANYKLYGGNIKLVKLPFEGTPKYDIVPDCVTEEKWQALTDRLGMRSIRDNVPYGTPRKSRGRKRGKEKGFGFGSA